MAGVRRGYTTILLVCGLCFISLLPVYASADSSKVQDSNNLRQYHDIKVMLYMTDWCPYCRKAKDYFKSLGVNLIEYNTDRDKDRKEEMIKKGSGSKLIPFVDIEGITIRGYMPDEYKSAIEKRRKAEK